MSTEKILLPNRYKDKNYLEPVEKGKDYKKFKLTLNDESGDLCRFIYNEGITTEDINTATESDLYAVDPSGGPFISIGCEITENEFVTNIHWVKYEGIYITTKNPNTHDKDKTKI